MFVVGWSVQRGPKDVEGAEDDPDVITYAWYGIAIVLMIVGAIGMSVSGASSTHYYKEYPCYISGDFEKMRTDPNNDGPRYVVCEDNPCDNKKYCKLK